VSSLIAASTDNGIGIAGAGWNTFVLPVRVLGKCGGFDSDIIDGMRWAAGLPVMNAPLNPTPAKIINLSLGGEGACNALYQAAIDEVTASGALVVASTGNDGTAVAAPANCGNVFAVSSVRHVGTKVGYSNLGPQSDLGAPGGNCGTTGGCAFPIVSATDAGTTGPTAPTYTDETVASTTDLGTSFSAPLVASAVALMRTVNPRLSPAQYATLLKESATPFPTSSATANAICRVPVSVNDVQGAECICTTSTCGAGLLNAAAAVNAALKPFGIVQAPTTIDPSVSVPIDGRTSFDVDGDPVTTYQWSILNVTGATPTIADVGTGTTTLQVTGNSRFTLRLRVTDDAGLTDDTDFAMVTSTPPEPPPTPPASTPIGGGGGGGGSFDWWLLVLGLLPLALPGPRRRKAARARGRSVPRSSLSDEVPELNSASRSYRRRRR
jgi:serine protease